MTSCTSTSGGGSGRFVVANLAGSYDGEDWDPALSASNRFFIESIGDYSAEGLARCEPRRELLRALVHGAGRHGRDRVLLAGHAGRSICPTRRSRRKPATSASRRPTGQPANNTSGAYWHNGYIYTADYSRGVDVLKFTGEIKGVIQPKVCWNVCDK